jgi:hypothetical protein
MSLRDQQQLGSCSGASRTACEERLNQLATKSTAKLLLSMMFAYLTNQKCCNCFGADNGATIAGSVQAAGQFGICHETLLPYTGQYFTDIPDGATTEGKAHLIQSHTVISDYDTAIQYLGTAGVIQIGIPVGDDATASVAALVETAARFAADPRLSFEWDDAVGVVDAQERLEQASQALRDITGTD